MAFFLSFKKDYFKINLETLRRLYEKTTNRTNRKLFKRR